MYLLSNRLLPRSCFSYYKVMGLERTVTQQQIRERYIRLAKKLHPDVKGRDDKGVHEKFAKINEAYEVLKDQEKRREYDRKIDKDDTMEADQMNFTQHNQDAYEQAGMRAEQEARARYYNSTEQVNLRRERNILKIAGLFVLFPCCVYIFFKERKYPTEHEIRRQNMILAKQNIDSRPSTIETRRKFYMEQMKRKQFRIVQFERQVNRYGNAFISQDHMKDPDKKGKSYTTIRKKKGSLESMKGMSKAQPIHKRAQGQQSYM